MMNKFNLHQNISPYLAIILLLVLSFAAALYTITSAREIIDNAKESAGFNIQKRQTINKASPSDVDRIKNN